jgi:hypothetical protein
VLSENAKGTRQPEDMQHGAACAQHGRPAEPGAGSAELREVVGPEAPPCCLGCRSRAMGGGGLTDPRTRPVPGKGTSPSSNTRCNIGGTPKAHTLVTGRTRFQVLLPSHNPGSCLIDLPVKGE